MIIYLCKRLHKQGGAVLATIKDVAGAAGGSIVRGSRGPKKKSHVNKEKRTRVLKAMAKMK